MVIWLLLCLVAGAGAGIAASTTVLRNAITRKGQQTLKEAEAEGEVIKKEKILQAKEKFLQLNLNLTFLIKRIRNLPNGVMADLLNYQNIMLFI